MTERIHSYSSPYNVGHKALAEYEDRPGLFDVPVTIEEKVDGSQFSFSRQGGEVLFRSRKAVVYPEDAGMFANGVNAILAIADRLEEGWTYRGEYLAKPKHNTLIYGRVPAHHVIIFDVETSPSHFLSVEHRAEAAESVGFEAVPVYYTGQVESLDQLREYLTRDSVLGGTIEGVVVKPLDYALFDRDKKVLMAKFVRADFKEKHENEWKKTNPKTKDVIEAIIDELRTPQRWAKAVQHLREAGELEESPRDIGALMKEVPLDIYKDEAEEIQRRLFRHFWKEISRGVTRGLAEWYKEKLASDAFASPTEFVPHESVLAEKGTGASPK